MGAVPCFHPLRGEGEFTISYHEMQKSVIFDLVRPGCLAVKRILDGGELFWSGYQYAGVDVSPEHQAWDKFTCSAKNGFQPGLSPTISLHN